MKIQNTLTNLHSSKDGDIQRHMYLQDLYISAADDKPPLGYDIRPKDYDI